MAIIYLTTNKQALP